MLCSNSMDTLGKKCRDSGEHYYLYKKTARILPLAFVDDLNAISRCGIESLALNTFINTQIELKKLKFHVADSQGKTKCHKLHIGNNRKMCSILKVGIINQIFTGPIIFLKVSRIFCDNTL